MKMIKIWSGWAVECNYGYFNGKPASGWLAEVFTPDTEALRGRGTCIFRTRADARRYGKKMITRKYCAKARAIKVKEFVEIVK